MTDKIPARDVLLPVAATLVIFLSSLLVPPLGIVIGILSPVPLIFIYLRGGKQVGLICLAIVVAVIFVTYSPRHALFFLAEYGVIAFIMGETIRFRFPIEKIIAFTALGSTFMSAAILSFAYTNEDLSLEEFIQEQVEVHLNQSADTFKAMGNDPGQQETFEKLLKRIANLLAVAYPSFIFVGSLFGSLVNYSVIGFFWRRVPDSYPYFEEKFNAWVLQENFIWAFIVSVGIVWFVPDGDLLVIGINGLVMSLAVYTLQGMAIAYHFLESKNVPRFVWVLLTAFIFSQPLLIGLLVGIGVFDLWADFRKLKTVKISKNEDLDET